MQVLNPTLIKNPINWAIIILMVVIGVLGLELILRAASGSWNCGCDS